MSSPLATASTASAAALTNPPSDYIGGRFIPIDGDGIVSTNPAAPDEVIYRCAPELSHVDHAIDAAARAFPAWAALSMDQRISYLRRWQEVTTKHADTLAALITDEMGKTLAESLFEAKALAAKVDITLDQISLSRVTDYQVPVTDTRVGECRFKPYGPMAVIGPFNFPAHLANGHFVPAMLTGNTIIFKPSEKTPAVGQFLAEMMHEIDLPPGVFNLVQGGPEVAKRLVAHHDLAGILFTGSWPVGRKILEANLDHPGRIIALEMGGNNPVVVMDDAHLKQAILECVRAGFATTGQRCTCTRRIILHSGLADRFIPAFCKAASTLIVGAGRDEPMPFMGPIVSEHARQGVLDFQDQLAATGGRVLLQAAAPDRAGWFITPGVVEVDSFTMDTDCEVFGPLVQITVVGGLDEAIEQANATRYGLAASIFTQSKDNFDAFFRRVNSGCINWNTGTAGASSKLPFGGRGHSGNNRPAAAFSVDYCAYPVANMIETSGDAAVPGGVQWDDGWI